MYKILSLIQLLVTNQRIRASFWLPIQFAEWSVNFSLGGHFGFCQHWETVQLKAVHQNLLIWEYSRELLGHDSDKSVVILILRDKKKIITLLSFYRSLLTKHDYSKSKEYKDHCLKNSDYLSPLIGWYVYLL